ncbi:MAG TPA: SIMPL domain-containing protein, partial [Smithellaceae bacterium]|nr:SIMPL domain-containing protein [Smithellaceae bacterium]
AVRVMTKNIDLVIKSLGETEKLLKAGVLLDGQMDGIANPRYTITVFNELRPQLLAEATKNARLTAQQFASDSGAKIGKIRSANQGTIQIFGSDGNDESAYYSPTSTPVKKIRVVSTFEFELK